jgi:hypothetical protein
MMNMIHFCLQEDYTVVDWEKKWKLINLITNGSLGIGYIQEKSNQKYVSVIPMDEQSNL